MITRCTITPDVPCGLTFGQVSGVCRLSGTPGTEQNTINYMVTAYNGATASDPASLSIRIVTTLDPPVLASISGEQFLLINRQATTITFTLSSGDIPNVCTPDPALPTGLSVTATNGTCEISGTPTAYQSTATEHTITATNGGGPGSTTVSILVSDMIIMYEAGDPKGNFGDSSDGIHKYCRDRIPASITNYLGNVRSRTFMYSASPDFDLQGLFTGDTEGLNYNTATPPVVRIVKNSMVTAPTTALSFSDLYTFTITTGSFGVQNLNFPDGSGLRDTLSELISGNHSWFFVDPSDLGYATDNCNDATYNDSDNAGTYSGSTYSKSEAFIRGGNFCNPNNQVLCVSGSTPPSP